MGFRWRLGVSVAIAAGLVANSVSFAQSQSPAGDRERGKALSNTCLGCHGIPGYRNAYPNYSVPKLEGQHPEYLVSALQAYRAGERSHITMHAQASSLSDQDMADIAAYFAGEPLKPDAKPEGQTPQAAQVCVACHGQDGVGITPLYPTLAGQHPDYILRALTEYRKGGRKNPVMKTFADQLKADQMEQLARYYSQQLPALQTEERPSTRLTARNR
jgi:cytochrome c553